MRRVASAWDERKRKRKCTSVRGQVRQNFDMASVTGETVARKHQPVGGAGRSCKNVNKVRRINKRNENSN